MAKYLRFNSLSPIEALAWMATRSSYTLMLANSSTVRSSRLRLTRCRHGLWTLQTIWEQSDTQIAGTFASSAAHIITDFCQLR